MRLQRAGQDLATNINLLIFGDKLRAKLFFSQLMDGDLTVDIVKKSSPSWGLLLLHPFLYCRERNGWCDQSPKGTQAGFAIVLTAATEAGSLSLALPLGNILSLGCCPQWPGSLCCLQGGEIPRLGLGTAYTTTWGHWVLRGVRAKETVCIYSSQRGLEASFDK